jgi:hypothetical protein
MASGLARHDELLLAAVDEHGGRVFKHTGDGICAVFPAPGPALRAAVAGQRRLRAERWEPAAPLSVRMAVHVGTAEERQGDYFGPTLNRVARLLDLAHGGQVLASEACRALVAEEPSPMVDLVDLGQHRLRDLGRPERVFQVGHPDLPTSFPPLRSSEAALSFLPLMPSPFVGRRRELGEVARLLATSRLVTLVGPGGAGKTRLALEAAAGAVDAFHDGVFFVDLAPLTEAAQVVSRVVASLGMVVDAIEGDASEGGRRRLIEYLRRRQALVVLDNCEHLLDEAACLADEALRSCPRLGLLATSREALRVPGESAWVVPPLSLPPAPDDPAGDAAASDAVALFCEWAVAVDPEFRSGPGNAARHRPDLPAPRRDPPGPRAGCRPPAGPQPRGAGRAPRRPVPPAHRRRPHRRPPPSDPTGRSRLGPRPADRHRADPAPAPGHLPRQLRAGGGRGGRGRR